jgi:nucleolar GTP-binding protein
MKNPFNEFFHVPNSQELLDIAFKKSMKSSAQVSKNAPILPDFYRELASVIVDTDKLKLTLGKLNGILPVLSKIEREAFKQLGRIEEPKTGDKIRRSVFGRISSVIYKQNKNLKYLNSIRGNLREIPSIDYTLPCVVVAGYPNVGKSSIVREISTNKKINVQEYPFTTKKLNLGHLVIKRKFDTVRIQIMDTPGILDRPMSKRNNIELQAILALRFISDLIIFIFDPSLASGYTVESQIKLFKEIKVNFSKEGKIGIIIVFNKMDIASESEIKNLKDELKLKEDEYFLTNALSGDNLIKIIDYLKSRYINNE